MTRNFKRAIILLGFTGVLSSCLSPKTGTLGNQSALQDNESQQDNKQLVEGNTAEYKLPVATQQKANYKEATELNAELTIGYTQDGYLDRAKAKLIKTQELARDHGYNLASVDYAAGYYYQTIGTPAIAEKYYKKAIYSHPKDFNSMNFYAQFLCQVKLNYADAQELFDKALYMSNNDNMAETLFLYSECMTKQGKDADALRLMQRADKFKINYLSAKLRLAEMYFDEKRYKDCYKVIYGMKNNKAFFNNKRILELRLKLAEYAHNKNEAATVRLIFSSNDFSDDAMNKFFEGANDGETSE
ncbi:MAG: type IV pilus assembly protein PilF [Francisella sp.]|jgi:type IV pilus assembly protein PilF